MISYFFLLLFLGKINVYTEKKWDSFLLIQLICEAQQEKKETKCERERDMKKMLPIVQYNSGLSFYEHSMNVWHFMLMTHVKNIFYILLRNFRCENYIIIDEWRWWQMYLLSYTNDDNNNNNNKYIVYCVSAKRIKLHEFQFE